MLNCLLTHLKSITCPLKHNLSFSWGDCPCPTCPDGGQRTGAAYETRPLGHSQFD